MKRHIQELSDKDIIRKNSSPYASQVVIVRKKNGSIRLCIEYRRLNLTIARDAIRLPRIDESLDALHGANYSVHVIWQADSIRLLWILIISTKQTSQPHFACMNILGCHLRSATHRRHFNASCSRRCCFFLILLTYLDDVIYSETIDEHHE